ncbi:unannotated protein [freshwater metagenome]|uniref:Unannotated protein n=1 Tax=freshwater metagenome TaxID=449393 RepID=A0A6J7GE36_9ZZZZ
MAEMSDRLSARRGLANSFFLSVQSALVATVALADGRTWPIGVAGIIVALAWFRLLRSYKTLNAAKFTVIHNIEGKLPAQPFKDEWDILDQPGQPAWKRYTALSTVEQIVPLVFAGLHALLLAT